MKLVGINSDGSKSSVGGFAQICYVAYTSTTGSPFSTGGLDVLFNSETLLNGFPNNISSGILELETDQAYYIEVDIGCIKQPGPGAAFYATVKIQLSTNDGAFSDIAGAEGYLQFSGEFNSQASTSIGIYLPATSDKQEIKVRGVTSSPTSNAQFNQNANRILIYRV